MFASDMTKQWGSCYTYIFGRRSYFSDSTRGGGYWNSGMWEMGPEKIGSGIITCNRVWLECFKMVYNMLNFVHCHASVLSWTYFNVIWCHIYLCTYTLHIFVCFSWFYILRKDQEMIDSIWNKYEDMSRLLFCSFLYEMSDISIACILHPLKSR